MLVFETEGHKYSSIDLFDDTKWVSFTKLCGQFRQPFPKDAALKASLNNKSKWYGMPVSEIEGHWQAENKRSTTLGTWYHEKQEKELIVGEKAQRYGKILSVISSIWEKDKKLAPDQKVTDGIYIEHLAYLKSAGICGQIDELIVHDGMVSIDDHKSNKDLKKPAYKSWDGKTKRMQPPLLHLEDTKLNEYALQLSLGLYTVLRHNPILRPGKLRLNHVTFEIEGENKFGYPIIKLDENNEPIVKGVEKIEVPYLKREVELMIEWLKYNRANV